MANYPFRINIATKSGRKIAYYTSSYATDADTAISASTMVAKINLLESASYEDGTTTPSHIHAGNPYRRFPSTGTGGTNYHLSASYITSPNTGSVVFTDKESATDSGLDYYTFWGTKVCSVLGLPEGIPIYTETFKLSDDSSNPSNYLSGDVIADGVAIKESFKIAPQGRMRSNLVWDHQFGEGLLQWVSGSASKLLFGYDDQADTYNLSAATAATFNISGVDTLTADKVAADIIYDASGTNLFMVAGRTTWSPTTFTNGQLLLDSTHDQGGIARNQMIGGFRIDYQEHDAWDNESLTYDYGLQINNRTLSDAVDTFAGISFDVGTESDYDSIAGAIAVLRNDTVVGSHAGNMIFCTNNAGASDGSGTSDDDLRERMRITHDGKVGIGVTDPVQALEVAGTNPQILISESATEFVRIGVEATTGDMCIGWDDSDDMHFGQFSSHTDTGITSRMVFSDSTGNPILIGRTTQAATSKAPKLEINGYISFDGFVSRAGTGGSDNENNTFNLYWDGSAGTVYVDTTALTPTFSTSDYRIKENVTTITGSFDNGILSRINTLRPIQYTQKSCSIFTQNDNVRPSFIAHELQEQFPDIVSGTKDEVDDDGLPVIQQFDSPGLTAYLVKAVQELTQAHNHLIAAITGSTDLNQLKASVTGSLIGT